MGADVLPLRVIASAKRELQIYGFRDSWKLCCPRSRTGKFGLDGPVLEVGAARGGVGDGAFVDVGTIEQFHVVKL
jgi:hypothetical protein